MRESNNRKRQNYPKRRESGQQGQKCQAGVQINVAVVIVSLGKEITEHGRMTQKAGVLTIAATIIAN